VGLARRHGRGSKEEPKQIGNEDTEKVGGLIDARGKDIHEKETRKKGEHYDQECISDTLIPGRGEIKYESNYAGLVGGGIQIRDSKTHIPADAY